MPRISKSGGAGMIGGVRSPMASTGHGLVGDKRKMNPPICGAPHKSAAKATVVSSPQKARDNVS
jgi:hypothetical protein